MAENYGFKFDNTYLELPDCFYSHLEPKPVPSPEMVLFNDALAQELGLDFSSASPKEMAALFSGNSLLKNTRYFAQAYAGHQFGHFTMLGDGRAIVWGEHTSPHNKKYDIQFKGSGPTPYSRQGDGRAALAPMLREYIISEAMHHLGIPTSRSLAVAKTGSFVQREVALPGAILSRVASSHLRIGTFEYAATQNNTKPLEALLNYTIRRHYPHLIDAENKAIALLKAVMESQIDLIVQWMRVGFIHGVQNTDNVFLSGESLDFGPCAFMDHYHPDTVFSSIDHAGRYAYQNQANIGQWNLARLAETLLPLMNTKQEKAVECAQATIEAYPSMYRKKYLAMMRAKIGLDNEDPQDASLIKDLLRWMQKNNADYNNTFLDLDPLNQAQTAPYNTRECKQWHEQWRSRLQKNTQSLESASKSMQACNPQVIPRNHIVEKALEASCNGDEKPLLGLLDEVQKPYEIKKRPALYQKPPSATERVYQTFCGT